MAKSRFKPTRTSIPGIYFIVGTAVATGKPERIYYVSCYRDGKRHFEKAGRQVQDKMTAAKANAMQVENLNKIPDPPSPDRMKAMPQPAFSN